MVDHNLSSSQTSASARSCRVGHSVLALEERADGSVADIYNQAGDDYVARSYAHARSDSAALLRVELTSHRRRFNGHGWRPGIFPVFPG